MRLTLGEQTHDLTTRALVVGVLYAAGADVDSVAARLAGEGADVVEVMAGDRPDAVNSAIRAAAKAGLPVAVVASCAEGARAAYAAGAVMGTDNVAGDGLLEVSAAAGAAVIVFEGSGGLGGTLADSRARLVQAARRAEAAGVPPHRIVVEPSLDRTRLPHIRRFAELGYPLLVTVRGSALDLLAGDGHDEPDERRAIALAATSLAIAGGCRLVRTDDVRGARRVADVLAAVLEAGA